MRVKRKIATMLFFIMMMGTICTYAKTYDFNLGIENSGYTSKTKKTTNSGTSTVMQSNPNLNRYKIVGRICNPSGSYKSSASTIYGVSTGYPSYAGYNVVAGDYVKLLVKNPAANGASINPRGEWLP